MREAGELALAMRATAARWDKSPGNPVTDADLAVDTLLKTRLAAPRPGYGWLSEETADTATRAGTRKVWVVDPIDGTRDYARGRDGWAVSVALVEDGRPTLALLHAPAQDRFYAASAGGGATLNGRPIRVSGRADPTGLRVPLEPQALASRLWGPRGWADAVAVPKPNSMALRVALVACGEADIAMDARGTNEWDMAACALILAEAGGAITDRDGRAYAFNKPRPTMPGVVAATPALHAHALGKLAEALRAMRRAGVQPSR